MEILQRQSSIIWHISPNFKKRSNKILPNTSKRYLILELSESIKSDTYVLGWIEHPIYYNSCYQLEFKIPAPSLQSPFFDQLFYVRIIPAQILSSHSKLTPELIFQTPFFIEYQISDKKNQNYQSDMSIKIRFGTNITNICDLNIGNDENNIATINNIKMCPIALLFYWKNDPGKNSRDVSKILTLSSFCHTQCLSFNSVNNLSICYDTNDSNSSITAKSQDKSSMKYPKNYVRNTVAKSTNNICCYIFPCMISVHNYDSIAYLIEKFSYINQAHPQGQLIFEYSLNNLIESSESSLLWHNFNICQFQWNQFISSFASFGDQEWCLIVIPSMCESMKMLVCLEIALVSFHQYRVDNSGINFTKVDSFIFER